MIETPFYKKIEDKVSKMTETRCISVRLTFESMTFLNNAEQVSPEWKQLEASLTRIKNKNISHEERQTLKCSIDKLKAKILSQESAQFPLAGLKGGLRYWWRALQWVPVKLQLIAKNNDQFPKDEATIDKRTLQTLHQNERELWGSAEEGKGIGCSKVRIRLKKSILPIHRANQTHSLTSDDNPDDDISSIQYIAGQGYKLREGKLSDMSPLRPVVSSHQSIDFVFQFSPELSDQSIRQVLEALLCFAEFGGLGSRSRKGFGSFSVQFTQSLVKENNQALSQEQLYKQLIQCIKNDRINNQQIKNWSVPPIPAFSAATLWAQFSVRKEMTDKQLLMTIGESYKAARLQIGQGDKDRIFKGQYPARLQVGFPLITYRFVIDEKGEKKIGLDQKPQETKAIYRIYSKNHEVRRRGALVFLSCIRKHIEKSEKKLINVLLLTSKYLPDNSKSKLSFKDNENKKEVPIPFLPQEVIDELGSTQGFFTELTTNLISSHHISEEFTVIYHKGSTNGTE
ncbi:RAMP superfamily CRISPR-associated protein [Vibrio aerogenes]|uniref:RAMP superfamily CRISPR-associated protein n=1 Tax=Vibrio aerogenes TaxID=92172 RepID=UPI0021C372A0|nr:RAMP superfamily CRISPR-associated protein [Vibrio aerogenes]